MRNVLSRALLLVALTALAAFAADNSVGVWKLNVEKSKYTGGPMPVKALTLNREAASNGVKVDTTGEQADGTPIKSGGTITYDGKDSHIDGNSPYDTIAVKKANDNTFTEERRKTGGPYKATSRMVISNGGKTMTITTKGINGQGKEFSSAFVFDKQ